MEWCSIFILVFLILLYLGVTSTIIIAIIQSPLRLTPGVIVFIIFMGLLMGLLVSCMVYHLVRACQAPTMSVHPEQRPSPVPLQPIPLQTKSGTLVQQPDGHLQIAIYEHPTSTNHPTTQVQ